MRDFDAMKDFEWAAGDFDLNEGFFVGRPDLNEGFFVGRPDLNEGFYVPQ